MIRVRFAPSPTGNLHIGGVRTALYNYLFARHNQGRFLLRIEDTDAERSKSAYTKHILESLEWLGLTIDEPEVFQSQRSSIYEYYFLNLRKSNALYPCFCTRQEIQNERDKAVRSSTPYIYSRRCLNIEREEAEKKIASGESHTFRFMNSGEKTIGWEDIIHGTITFPVSKMDDFIVKRTDGSFTYNFCVVVDDIEMDISHVIRGDDHISNTPRQLMVYKALGAKPPCYAHIPLILGPDRKRLSKRHGACGLLTFRESGYLKEAMINFCALMGWSWDDKTTIFTKNELIDKFSLDRISSGPAVFDQDKLLWLNKYYLRSLPLESIMEDLADYQECLGQLQGNDALVYPAGLVDITRQRVDTLADLACTLQSIWNGPIQYDEKALQKCRKKFLKPGLLEDIIHFVTNIQGWSIQSIETELRSWSEEKGYKFGSVAQIIRLAMTGKLVSPPIIECVFYLGKDASLKRLHVFADYIRKIEMLNP